MIACFIIIGLAVVLLFFYVYFKSKKYDLKELFLKIGLSFLFIILALIATINSNKLSTFNILITIGLLLGLLGDIFLDLKYIDLERSDAYTYAGFIVFGIGHILYIIALIMNYYDGNIIFIILPIALSIILSIITILLEKPLKLKYGKYKIISLFYAFCLFSTLLFSLFLAISNNFSIITLNMIFVGAILFTISDLVLSTTFFGEGKERPIDFILNYLTYYGAQYIIALSLLYK